MNRHIVGCALACVLALAAGVAAQTQPPNPQPPQQTPPQATADTVTVEGCLVREQDVPGRKPNVVERQGVLEDYILTSTKIVKGSAPAKRAGEARPETTPRGTSGVMPEMYDVKGLDPDKLKTFVGKRVQIDGTFADLEKSATAKPTEDLIDLRGTTIREVPGTCPPPK